MCVYTCVCVYKRMSQYVSEGVCVKACSVYQCGYMCQRITKIFMES